MLFLHIFDTSVLRNTPDFTSHCLVRNMSHFAKTRQFFKDFFVFNVKTGAEVKSFHKLTQTF